MSYRSIFVVATLLLLAAAGFAQNSMLRGKVRGNNGTTINNASIELRGSTGAVIGQAFSRNDGDFSFSRLAAGEYEVLVTMSGYDAVLQRVELRDSMRVSTASDVTSEVVYIEVVLRPRPETPLAAPGTSFAQDVPKVAREAYAKGVSRLREGKSDEGIALLREATSEFNDYFDAHLALGLEFYRVGKDPEALEALERARQINEKGYLTYYTFGLVMVRQQKFRAAEYAFGKAAEFNDRHINAHFNHAVALIEVAMRSKAPEEIPKLLLDADKELDRAWDLSEKKLNTVFLQRARVHEERGNKEAAARELEKYLKAEPDAKNAASVKEAIAKLRAKK
ncbi:MAG TPA: carboxypeptidase regulatory-like domain-containing protein [Blastocatellia bacterium]|nr:carboxypeptidase regulatory-like domain-containing protein [Blastocatellia bacterium]